MAVEKHGAEMSQAEIADFLEGHGVGTLAFGNAEGAYAIPMSFGYHRRTDTCFFQFAFDEDSRKAKHIEEDNTVALCVFEWTSTTDWRSVVIEGDLNDIPADASPEAASVFAAYADIATLDVFDVPLNDLDLSWYHLYIENKRGRQATTASSDASVE